MLAYVDRELARSRPPRGLVRVMLGALDDAAGYDAAPLAPWENRTSALRDARTRARIATAWRRWYAHHAQAADLATLQRDGLARSRQDLASSDPVVRFAAIRRLLAHGSDDERAQAGAALTALGARTDLAGTARAYMLRFARHGTVETLAGARDDPA
jgi:hypothetical protein